MDSSTIISMIIINGFVIGGFIFFLRIAINKERKKKSADAAD